MDEKITTIGRHRSVITNVQVVEETRFGLPAVLKSQSDNCSHMSFGQNVVAYYNAEVPDLVPVQNSNSETALDLICRE